MVLSSQRYKGVRGLIGKAGGSICAINLLAILLFMVFMQLYLL
jgi:hypothetical protein